MSQAAGVFPPQSTRRLGLKVAGQVFDRWTSAVITRDLREISGSFTVEYVDSGRLAQTVSPNLDTSTPFQIIKPGLACSVLLDGEVALTGYVDDVELEESASGFRATIHGRDKTGDLVDCAAAPNGPAEWKGLNALQVAQAICKPFGISVRAEVDVGAAFPVFGINQDENAMPAIERAVRQRALLMVSDGVGGLVLTVGGNTRAPAQLLRPGNIQETRFKSSWTERFSDYYVKGQTNKTSQRAAKSCKVTPATNPATAPVAPPDDADQVAEVSTVVMTGHATDPEIARYRPNVRGVMTQSGTASVQAQAEWALRIARGMSYVIDYTVIDWRAGPANALWLVNQVVRVTDPYSDINRDMLISGVTYRMSEKGIFTDLKIAGRTAFDRIDEPASSKKIFKKAPTSFGPTKNG